MRAREARRNLYFERRSVHGYVARLSPRSTALVAFCATLALFVLPSSLRGHDSDVVLEALQIFPAETSRLEHWNSTQLRTVPNYARLRSRYLDPPMQKVERSLAGLGIQESDVDELVLGWRGGAGRFDLYGLAAGHFNSTDMARRAQAAGLKPTQVGGLTAYCFASESNPVCVTIFGDTRGAFGPPAALEAISSARTGTPSNLASTPFAALVQNAMTDTSIWGVATGPAIGDWFKSSMPEQESLQLNWSQAFADVTAITYSVKASDRIHLTVEFDCNSGSAASRVRGMLDGLRTLQQLAWQSRTHGQTNPFQNVEVGSSGSRAELKLETPYPPA